MTALGRQCGECTLCCRLLPVSEFNKPANQRCQYQRAGKGCSIYNDRPKSCRIWSCLWLSDQETKDLARPDRSHYVIDPSPDFIQFAEALDKRISVIQVWVDPRFPDAHNDPAFRAWVNQRAERTFQAVLIRYSSTDAFVLFPPAMTGDGWVRSDAIAVGKDHSARETLEAQAAADFNEWLHSKPESVRKLAGEFPIGVYDIDGVMMYLIGYGECDELILSRINPVVDYEGAVKAQIYVCASHLRAQ